MLFSRSSLVDGGRVGVASVCKFSTTMETVRVGPKAVLSLWIRFQELDRVNRKSGISYNYIIPGLHIFKLLPLSIHHRFRESVQRTTCTQPHPM